MQGLSPADYESQKERVADEICERLETLWPGLRAAIEFREVSCLIHSMHNRYRACIQHSNQPITHLLMCCHALDQTLEILMSLAVQAFRCCVALFCPSSLPPMLTLSGQRLCQAHAGIPIC